MTGRAGRGGRTLPRVSASAAPARLTAGTGHGTAATYARPRRRCFGHGRLWRVAGSGPERASIGAGSPP
jgi:hypothetical protein